MTSTWQSIAAATCRPICTVNGRVETIAFRRDQGRPNQYRAVLPLESITGLKTTPIDVEERIDIEMRPSDIGRYQGQGLFGGLVQAKPRDISARHRSLYRAAALLPSRHEDRPHHRH